MLNHGVWGKEAVWVDIKRNENPEITHFTNYFLRSSSYHNCCSYSLAKFLHWLLTNKKNVSGGSSPPDANIVI